MPVAPDASLMTSCSDFNEVADAVLRLDSPFYGAAVSNPDIAALQEELDSLIDDKDFDMRGKSIEWPGSKPRPILEEPLVRSRFLEPNEIPRHANLIARWKQMTSVLFPRNHKVALFDTEPREGNLNLHVDNGTTVLLTTAPYTEILTTRSFEYGCHRDVSATAEEMNTLWTPAKATAIVLAFRTSAPKFLAPRALGHRGRKGHRLALVAHESIF